MIVTALARRELATSLTEPQWIELVECLRADAFPWLLDSALPAGGLGRFSFAGADPYLVVRAYGRRVELERRREVRPDLAGSDEVRHGDPFEILHALLPPRPEKPGYARGGERRTPGAAQGAAHPPFAGGAIGYLGYELAEHTEGVALRAPDDLGLPDLAMLFVDRVLVFEHATGRLTASGLGFAERADTARRRAEAEADTIAERIFEALRALESGSPASDPGPARETGGLAPQSAREAVTSQTGGAGHAAEPSAPEAGRVRRAGTGFADASDPGRLEVRRFFDEPAYARLVEWIREEIHAGNVYQANLTHRLDVPFEGDPGRLYRALRRLNPAPFACRIELPEVVIAGSSPERFLRVEADGRVESRPIKGTRPRGATPEEDERRRRELAASEKDRAENVMIVDLVRNDLGRVCEPGSVAVPRLRAVEGYATVFQLVSTVTGRLRRGCDALDALRAAFPPGSMTGAPKRAAIELLDRIEPVRRGVYSGALGYLDARGGADFCVVIRTLLLCKGRASLHVGGAVVADSDPIAEHRETLDKARGPLSALAAARSPSGPWP